ncbi:MAG: hypothetical protein WD335_00310 [Candidatus Paceibacterota bacterium]
MATGKKNSQASQKFVPINEIRDGVAILDDGSLRAILMASSINFALKSQEEQQAVLMQFQNFLNSLDFSVQFHIESRNLNIKPYLESLKKEYQKQDNELMKTQISEYIEFVRTFTENTNVMQKTFFVVIPYNRSVISSSGGIMESIQGMLGGRSKEDKATAKEESFQEAHNQLRQRIQIVRQGLVRTGVRVTQLGTEENIELFYRLFNPGNLEQKITDSNI